MKTETSKIYLVISEIRERGTNDIYEEPQVLWAERNKELAEKRCQEWNKDEENKDSTLEFHYRVKEITLY